MQQPFWAVRMRLRGQDSDRKPWDADGMLPQPRLEEEVKSQALGLQGVSDTHPPPPDACGARHMVDAQRTPATTPALFQASDVQREGATCHMLDKGVTGSQTQHAGRSGQYTGSPA